MTTIKVLGVCCYTECPKKNMGLCQNYRPNVPDDDKCRYCECDAGAHTLVCYEVTPVSSLPIPVSNAVISNDLKRRLHIEEDSKKNKKVVLLTEEGDGEVRKPTNLVEDADNNRATDRLAALNFAPEGIIKTDMDMGQFYQVGHEYWMPPTVKVDPITDYTTYCFACNSQLTCSDREPCAGPNCARFMFIECGHYGHLMAENETEHDISPNHFRCCDCKQRSYQNRLFDAHMAQFMTQDGYLSKPNVDTASYVRNLCSIDGSAPVVGVKGFPPLPRWELNKVPEGYPVWGRDIKELSAAARELCLYDEDLSDAVGTHHYHAGRKFGKRVHPDIPLEPFAIPTLRHTLTEPDSYCFSCLQQLDRSELVRCSVPGGCNRLVLAACADESRDYDAYNGDDGDELPILHTCCFCLHYFAVIEECDRAANDKRAARLDDECDSRVAGAESVAFAGDEDDAIQLEKQASGLVLLSNSVETMELTTTLPGVIKNQLTQTY